jgi:phage gpG-like protein
MTVRIEVSGIAEVSKSLKNKQVKIMSNANKGLFNASVFLQGEVKQSIAGRRDELASVDTGRFLNSVDISVSKDKAAVFSKVPYAKFLEFGTSRFPARRHFTNSTNRNKKQIVSLVKQEISKD